MNKGVNIIIAIFSVAFFIYMVNSIFKFLDISFASYGNYLLWMVALMLFYFLLPKKVGKMF